MALSLRLDAKTEAMVERLSKSRGQTKSEVVRDAIHMLAADESPGRPTAFEQLRPFIGRVDSGGSTLSERTGEQFRSLLEAKRNASRSR